MSSSKTMERDGLCERTTCAIEQLIRKIAVRPIEHLEIQNGRAFVQFSDGSRVKQDILNSKFLFIVITLREFDVSTKLLVDNIGVLRSELYDKVVHYEEDNAIKLYQIFGIKQG